MGHPPAWLIRMLEARTVLDLLNAWRFDSLVEARVHLGDWRIDYKCNWPHTDGDLTRV